MSSSTYWLEHGHHVATAVVVRMRPQAIPLAMISMRKWTHGFPFLSHDAYGAPFGGHLGQSSAIINSGIRNKKPKPKNRC